jgi:uncharacterized protein
MRTLVLALACGMGSALCAVNAADGQAVNLALVAKVTTSFVSGHENLSAVNDGWTPANSDDKSRGAYGNWPQSGTQWVAYEWSRPISTAKIEVYWFDDQRGVRLPKACRLLSWNGNAFVPVSDAKGLGLLANQFNVTEFAEVTTSKLRLEFDSNGGSSTGILDWRVYDSGKSPNFPPSVSAGIDRTVILGGKTYLEGSIKDDGKPKAAPTMQWSKASGPGEVFFADAAKIQTTAEFSAVGAYVLKFTGDDGESSATDTLTVTVDPRPQGTHLNAVPTTAYAITSPLWRARAKALIVNWIPHCIKKIEDPKVPEGGIENFAQAGLKLAGRADAKHVGAPFANAWVYNTLESMCAALMVDPQGDKEIEDSQAAMRTSLEVWIKKMLSAQEPDGYIQTMYTIQGHKRWSNKFDHEGYNAGYFIDAATAHYRMTGGKDTRMYDAAKRCADCWCENIGPAPKRYWYEGHEELEMALVGFARLVEEREGAGKGAKYVALAKFLCDSRKDGDEYDQSHLPLIRQYEAVGHAVRAVYCYAGMTDVAMETGDIDYLSALKSIWRNIVDRKYYVTGGVGSGETSEGFGKDYSLPNSAYCESCAGCGELFFQHKLHMLLREAKYADLYEETLYNAILGSVDLEGRNFTYTNPLDSSEHRYLWHVCPCCVGNIPRTLLRLPTWLYTTSGDSLYVNLFVGSVVKVGTVAGTSVTMTQTTDYPFGNKVSIAVAPAASARFAVKIRVPDRGVSGLYAVTPASNGIESLAVNGQAVAPAIEGGYAVIAREWKAGDTIELVLPLKVQRITADKNIAATRGKVALRVGPIIYNFESVDQKLDGVLPANATFTTEWKPDLLGGVMVVKGAFADGTPFMAIPNYARLNRGGRSIVWVKGE